MNFDRLRNMFADEDAVSPVIGVILMVAITVILAAVIGTFVLGLGQDVTESQAPTADFQFDYDPSSGDTVDADGAVGGVVTVTHNGGDSIDKARLTVSWSGTLADGTSTWSDPVAAGDSYDVEATDSDGFAEGDTVRVIWSSEGGGSSQTLATYDIPSGSDEATDGD